MTEPVFDHVKLDVKRPSMDYVAASYGIAKALGGRAFELKRIVSMLTRLIQQSDGLAQDGIEYEYEYRDAEYEQECREKPEQGRQSERPTTRFVKSQSLAAARLRPAFVDLETRVFCVKHVRQ